MYCFGSELIHRNCCHEVSLSKAVARTTSRFFRSRSWISSGLSLAEYSRSSTWLGRWSWDKYHPLPFVRKTPVSLASSHLQFLPIGPGKDAIVRKAHCFRRNFRCKVQRDLFLRSQLAKEKGSLEWSVDSKDPYLGRFCLTPSHGKKELSLTQ